VPLDPQAQIVIDQIEAVGFGEFTEETDPVAVRSMMDAAAPRSAITLHEVSDREIPGPNGPIPIRIYRPDGNAPKPIIVYAHGGGWVLGSLDTHDDACRGLAAGVDSIVVSVDYRLAPEHPFPAAVDDYLASLAWVHANARSFGGDPDRLAVAGDSAGGNLAAIGAQDARSRGLAVAFQLLVYPVTDYEFTSASMEENAVGYYLTRDMMRWFYERYLRDETEGADARVSPIRAEDLSGLAPAFVITAQYDPLRDQGRAYASAMRAAGNLVTSTTYDGMFHGFFTMSALLDGAKVAFADAVGALRTGLAVD